MVVAVAATGLILWLVPDKPAIMASFRRTSLPLLLVAVFLIVIAHLADAWRLWWLCRIMNVRIPLLSVFQILMASNFVAFVTPFMGGGAPCTVWLLNRRGMSVPQASAVVLAVGVVSRSALFALAVAVPLLAGVNRAQDSFSRLIWTSTLAVVPFFLATLVVLAAGSYRIDYIHGLLASWERRLASRGKTAGGWGRLHNLLRATSGGLRVYHGSIRFLATRRPSSVFFACLCALAHFVLEFTAGYCVFRALSLDPGFFRSLAAFILIFLLASAAPTPGGSGASEIGAYSIFTYIAPQGIVAAFVITWRATTYWLQVLAGAVCLAFALHTPGLRSKRVRRERKRPGGRYR
jgi:uncharacterized protein (TIRG00374 family)